MEDLKKQQIAQAALERFPDASTIFITNDEQSFDDVNKAIAAAVALSSGNPEVHEVAVKSFVLTQGLNLDKLSKQEKIDAATKQIADAQALVAEKQIAYDNAEPVKKGAAKNALNKAIAKEAEAQVALDAENELPDDQA